MDKITTVKNWLLSRIGNPYLMGGTGQPCTVAYREARAAQYPGSAAKIKANCPRMSGKATSCAGCRYYDESIKNGKRAYDCAQLTRWAMDAGGIQMVSGATSQWRETRWAEMGDIATLPKDKLCLVYRQDDKNVMGHTGVYLGDGTVAHARGHDYGVVRDSLTEYSKWTHWGIPEGLYDAFPIHDNNRATEQYQVTGVRVALRKGMTTSSAILTRIEKGTIVEGAAASFDWIAVTYKGQSGYMMAEYLQALNVVGDADDEPVSPAIPAPAAPQGGQETVTLTVDRETAEKLAEALQAGLGVD